MIRVWPQWYVTPMICDPNDDPNSSERMIVKVEDCKIRNLFNNLEHTLAKELLEKFEYPWEVLPYINDFIIEMGKKLDKNIYEQ